MIWLSEHGGSSTKSVIQLAACFETPIQYVHAKFANQPKKRHLKEKRKRCKRPKFSTTKLISCP